MDQFLPPAGAREYAQRHIERLYDISRLLARFKNIEVAVREVLTVVTEALPLRNAILIEEEADGRPRTTVWQAPHGDAEQLRAAEDHARRAYDNLVPLARARLQEPDVTHVEVDELVERARAKTALDKPERRQTLIFLPLVTERLAIFGAFQFENDTRSLDPVDLAFLNAIVNQLANALDRHYAWKKEIAHRERVETLAAENARLLAEAARLYAQAQAAVQAREEFVSLASHELKAPLTVLQLQLQKIVGTRPTQRTLETIQKSYGVLERQVGRLTMVVTNLLDVARIANGDMDLLLEEVDLSDLAGEVVERFGLELERANVPLSFHAEQPVIGRWSRFRLEQIVTNLLSNALKYGNGKPIEVRVLRAGDLARVLVRDHGIGIALEDQARIFEPYTRTQSGRERATGLGLGLYIAQGIVTRIGGSIRVESEPGQGASFTVDLPLDRETPV